MHSRSIIILSAFALTACGGGEAAAPKEAEVPAKLPAGTYEVTATVKSLVSTDNTPVPTFAKVGDVIKTQGCVGADGILKPEALATEGDVCRIKDPYLRNGRANLTLDCSRKGKGTVMGSLDGSYTAKELTGTLTSTSAFVGSGDYKLVEDIVARKVSDQCTVTPAGDKPAKA